MMGKNGAKRKHQLKVLNGVQPKRQAKKDHGYAKHSKRRALRTVVVPSELVSKGKRTNKKLLLATVLVDHQIKQAEEAKKQEASMADTL